MGALASQEPQAADQPTREMDYGNRGGEEADVNVSFVSLEGEEVTFGGTLTRPMNFIDVEGSPSTRWGVGRVLVYMRSYAQPVRTFMIGSSWGVRPHTSQLDIVQSTISSKK